MLTGVNPRQTFLISRFFELLAQFYIELEDFVPVFAFSKQIYYLCVRYRFVDALALVNTEH